jgi:SAM-dependent methyltransferase
LRTLQEAEFESRQGILAPRRPPDHRNDEYDEAIFDVLLRMQRRHFWHRGRNRLLLNVLQHELPRHFGASHELRAIDMGGGCGGWLAYLHRRRPRWFRRLALGDSSLRALTLAESVVSAFAARYQIDLLALPWRQAWDVVFLLDVLEHIPDDRAVLRQVRESLRPGGLLLVTAPALKRFWTYNDTLARHQRRYCKQDFRELGEATGLTLVRAGYFMFLLSPALLLSRFCSRPPASAGPEELRRHLARTHRIPARPINEALAAIFLLEAALINHVRFPWGTSVLAVFQRPPADGVTASDPGLPLMPPDSRHAG